MKMFIVLCLLGLTVAAPQNQRLLEEPIDIPEPYQFAIEVKDDETTNYQSRQESQDELGNVQGEYTWIAPDGFRYTTTYSATPEGGFQANTRREPTDIVVIIPKPDPKFQNQL